MSKQTSTPEPFLIFILIALTVTMAVVFFTIEYNTNATL